MGILSGVLTLLVCFLQDRRPVPDADQLAAAERTIREVFKEDFAKKSQMDRKTFAEKLLTQGLATVDDPTIRYALLREAVQTAAEVGDPATVLKAADALSVGFQVPFAAFASDSLGKAAKAVRSPEGYRSLALAYLEASDRAISTNELKAAADFASSAENAVRKGQDVPLLANVQARAKRIKDLAGHATKVSEAQKVLAINPDDAEASLTVGRFCCLQKGDWKTGIPFLAKCSDKLLKALAEKELVEPKSPDIMMELAEEWFNASDKASMRGDRSACLRRARHWYKKASSELTGFTKTKADIRISECEKLMATSPVDLIGMIDPSKDAVRGKWAIKDRMLTTSREGAARLQIPYAPPLEYDVEITAKRADPDFKDDRGTFWIGLIYAGKQFLLISSPEQTYLDGVFFTKGQDAQRVSKGPLLRGAEPVTFVCKIRHDSVTVLAGGTPVITAIVDHQRATENKYWGVPNARGLFLGADISGFVISKLSLVAVEGDGTSLR
jgi:hypothetical protein